MDRALRWARRALPHASGAYLDALERPALDSECFIEDETTCTQCYVYPDKRTMTTVVAFRGSESATDCLYDARITRRRPVWMEEEPRARVHKGFLAAYQSVADRVKERVRAVSAFLGGEVLVTGHSLGGALSILFCADFSREAGDTRVLCVTFGAPRVGNSPFVRAFDAQVDHCATFTCGRDIVTALPSKLLGRFADTPGCVWLDGKGGARPRPPRMVFRKVSDHGLDAYERALGDEPESPKESAPPPTEGHEAGDEAEGDEGEGDAKGDAKGYGAKAKEDAECSLDLGGIDGVVIY